MNLSDGKANILTDPSDYNDLETAWTKSRVEITNEFSDNQTLDANIALIINNANLAGKIAKNFYS